MFLFRVLFLLITPRNCLNTITQLSANHSRRTVLASSNTGVVGSNLSRNMNICVPFFCVYVVLCIGRVTETI
jgi:hypothetical protein